jgi:hypothetical protein
MPVFAKSATGVWTWARVDFNYVMTDQLGDTLPAGVMVSERITLVEAFRAYNPTKVITGSFATDNQGTVGDRHGWTFFTTDGFVTVTQTVIIGTWAADLGETLNANAEWSGNTQSIFH